MLDVPRTNAPLLITLTLFAPELLSNTAPVKAFDCVNVIGLALALKLEIPGTVNAPVCVRAPAEVIVRFWPTVEAAKIVPMLLVRLTLFVPLLESATLPVKLLLAPLVDKSIAFAPALKLDVPPTVNAPV